MNTHEDRREKPEQTSQLHGGVGHVFEWLLRFSASRPPQVGRRDAYGFSIFGRSAWSSHPEPLSGIFLGSVGISALGFPHRIDRSLMPSPEYSFRRPWIRGSLSNNSDKTEPSPNPVAVSGQLTSCSQALTRSIASQPASQAFGCRLKEAV